MKLNNSRCYEQEREVFAQSDGPAVDAGVRRVGTDVG